MAVNKETYECDHGIREKGFTVNPLTPMMLFSILLCSCNTSPCKLIMRIWCWIKITTST